MLGKNSSPEIGSSIGGGVANEAASSAINNIELNQKKTDDKEIIILLFHINIRIHYLHESNQGIDRPTSTDLV